MRTLVVDSSKELLRPTVSKVAGLCRTCDCGVEARDGGIDEWALNLDLLEREESVRADTAESLAVNEQYSRDPSDVVIAVPDSPNRTCRQVIRK